MPKGGNKLNVLPSIILSSKTKYLAMLFSALDASEAPFNDFTKTSSQFLKISCQAFKSIWPHFNITLKTDDVLFNVMSCSIAIIEPNLSFTYRATNAWLNDEARFMMLQGHLFRTILCPGSIHVQIL